MREFLTDKDYITTKLLLVAKIILAFSFVVFFAPLFILPFFNHPSTDDYFLGYYLNKEGFWKYQSFIYNNWGGRFSATFVGALFAKNNWLYNHYYFHSILLLIANAASVFFTFGVINKYILKDERLRTNIVWICLLYLVLQFVCAVEVSTYNFWFSSAVTYQLPIILLQFQVGLWIVILQSKSVAIKSIAIIFLPLIVFIVNGFNELFIVVQAFILLLPLLSKAYKKLNSFFLVVVIIAFIVSAFIVVLSPGIHERTAIIEPKGILVGGAALSYHIAETLWSIFSKPLLWVILFITFLYANKRRNDFKKLLFANFFYKKRWLLPATVVILLGAMITIAVIGLKGGVIPDRYVNGVIVITISSLLLLSFTEGIFASQIAINIFSLQTRLVLLFTYSICTLSNNYIKDAYKSIISAPLYSNIMHNREQTLQQAAITNKIADLTSYNNEMHNLLEKDYSNSTKTLYDLVQQKPSFIFFEDDLATEYSINMIRGFYKVDTIIVK